MKSIKILIPILALILLIGCSTTEQPSTPNPDPVGEQQKTPDVTRAPDPATQAAEDDFVLTTADGVELQGTWYSTTGEKTVLLLHMLGRNREDWKELATSLQGFQVLAVDLRGMGESNTKNEQPYSYVDFTDEDYAKLITDAVQIVDTIGNVDTVVGASIGANTALQLAAQRDIKKLVLLSPGADYRGISGVDVARNVQTSTLIIASEEDGYSAQSSSMIDQLMPNSQFILKNNLGHGTNMLADAATFIDITNFITSK